MEFELHTIESAPESVKTELEAAQAAYGAVPNLYRGMASSPAALKLYLAFNEILQEFGQLTPVERQVVYLTISAENGCTYCMGAHSVLATMAKISEQTLKELRDRVPLSDPKLNALRNFSLAERNQQGWVSEQALSDFQDAGYNESHMLEVITILAQKTISNYFNHIAKTPLDKMFESMSWQPAE